MDGGGGRVSTMMGGGEGGLNRSKRGVMEGEGAMEGRGGGRGFRSIREGDLIDGEGAMEGRRPIIMGKKRVQINQGEGLD